jgi:hypothetical protein
MWDTQDMGRTWAQMMSWDQVKPDYPTDHAALSFESWVWMFRERL